MPRADTNPKDFYEERGRLGRFEIYGQYNKLIKAFIIKTPQPH